MLTYFNVSLRLGFRSKMYAFLTSPTRNKATAWTTKVSNPDRCKNISFSKSSIGILRLKQSPIQWEPRLRFWFKTVGTEG